MSLPKVICFGEVLWDLLPSGKVAGGAPMNVAFHLNNFGYPTSLISRVGHDPNGWELMKFLKEKGIDTELVQTDNFYPTSTVKVILGALGSPSYEIVQPVAWDYLNVSLRNTKAVEAAKAIVYGSLAARTERTRDTLLSLLNSATDALKIFDVNLRAPFYKRELLEQLLDKADIVKMNDEELRLIGGWYFADKDAFELAQKMKEKFNLKILMITQGGKGAFLISPSNEVKSVRARQIKVADTIGSGDSFLAGFLYQYFLEEPLIVCLEFAARTGALVATMRGATPKIDEDMVVSLR
ncbi:MAG: carbohydrate kinase [Saprospiraceae bacterium]